MKKILFTIIIMIILIPNVNADQYNDVTKKEKEIYHKIHNPKTGVNNLKDTLIPIGVCGGLLIFSNIQRNKKNGDN